MPTRCWCTKECSSKTSWFCPSPSWRQTSWSSSGGRSAEKAPDVARDLPWPLDMRAVTRLGIGNERRVRDFTVEHRLFRGAHENILITEQYQRGCLDLGEIGGVILGEEPIESLLPDASGDFQALGDGRVEERFGNGAEERAGLKGAH